MPAGSGGSDRGEGPGRDQHVDLIPRDFLRIIAVWSIVPSYLVAGGLIGYLADRLAGLFPYLTGGGLLVALAVAVRDVYRLRDEF